MTDQPEQWQSFYLVWLVIYYNYVTVIKFFPFLVSYNEHYVNFFKQFST